MLILRVESFYVIFVWRILSYDFPGKWGSSVLGNSVILVRTVIFCLGAIQLLLYNMSSMLASVAAGYDVRLSNVSPIHPRLHPPHSRSGGRPGGSSPPPATAGRLYPHNTYHGHTPHHRTPLAAADIKPLRFTDSPQHALSARYQYLPHTLLHAFLSAVFLTVLWIRIH